MKAEKPPEGKRMHWGALLITLAEAAHVTGMSEQWWRHAIAGRKQMPPIRVVRIGGAVRLHRQDLLDWINGEEMPTAPQPRKRGRPRKMAQAINKGIFEK
jgi:predicted DNA-binding transcriptional regulator AlpA